MDLHNRPLKMRDFTSFLHGFRFGFPYPRRIPPSTFVFGYPASPLFRGVFSRTHPTPPVPTRPKKKKKRGKKCRNRGKRNRKETERGSPVGFPVRWGSTGSKGKVLLIEKKRLKGKKGIDRWMGRGSTGPRPDPFPRGTCHVTLSTNRMSGLTPESLLHQSLRRTAPIDQSKRTTFFVTCVATRPLAMADFGRRASQETSFTCTCACKRTPRRLSSTEEGSQGML